MGGHDHYHKKQTNNTVEMLDIQAQGTTNLAQLLVFMLILLRQYAKICPSLLTIERWESSEAKRAEGRESGHSPIARMELPQVSCACKEETCFSSKACTSLEEIKHIAYRHQHMCAITKNVHYKLNFIYSHDR